KRAGDASGTATVQYSTVEGSALAGIDYLATNGTLTFAPGVRSQSFVVAIIDDDLHEFDEFFGVEFSNVTGAWPTVAPTGVNIISDEPPPPYLFTDTPAVPESAGIVNILVSRYGDLNGSTTVDYATADGTAVAGDDYVSTNGTLTFGPGEATKSITVTLISDN